MPMSNVRNVEYEALADEQRAVRGSFSSACPASMTRVELYLILQLYQVVLSEVVHVLALVLVLVLVLVLDWYWLVVTCTRTHTLAHEGTCSTLTSRRRLC